MALTIEQQPTATIPQPAYEPIVYVLSSSVVTNFKFRFVADVLVDGSRVARIKVLPNPNNVGVIRCDQIISQYLDATIEDQNTAGYTVHTLGENDGTKLISISNGETFRTIELQFGEEFATTATGTPTLTISSTGNLVRVLPAVGSNIGDKTALKMPNDEGGSFNVVAGDDDWLSITQPLSAGKRFLTTRPVSDTLITDTALSGIHVIQEAVTYEDYRTLSFVADNSVALGTLYLIIDTVDLNGVANRFQDTLTDLGGVQPSAANTDAKRLQYIGIGPANILGYNTTIDADFAARRVAYYEVFLSNSSNPTNGSQVRTQPIRYNVISADCMYKQEARYPSLVQTANEKINYATLIWQNTLGGWDYQTFAKRHDRTLKDIKRTTYDSIAGNYSTASSSVDFRIKGWTGGKTVTKTTGRQEIRANTDVFNEDEIEFLEGLQISPRVYLMNYNKRNAITPVVIKDTSFIRKKGVNEQGVFTMSVTFEFAREKATVR